MPAEKPQAETIRSFLKRKPWTVMFFPLSKWPEFEGLFPQRPYQGIPVLVERDQISPDNVIPLGYWNRTLGLLVEKSEPHLSTHESINDSERLILADTLFEASYFPTMDAMFGEASGYLGWRYGDRMHRDALRKAIQLNPKGISCRADYIIAMRFAAEKDSEDRDRIAERTIELFSAFDRNELAAVTNRGAVLFCGLAAFLYRQDTIGYELHRALWAQELSEEPAVVRWLEDLAGEPPSYFPPVFHDERAADLEEVAEKDAEENEE